MPTTVLARALALALLALGVLTTASAAQVVEAPFNAAYAFADVGAPPGVPAPLGGLTTKTGDPDVLVIGGRANEADGAVYEIGLTRDGLGHINGFSGTAVRVAGAPFIDGGLAYGPGGVLFFTQYPSNAIGQIKPASTAPDRLTPLGPPGPVAQSTGSLQFVPPGLPGAGSLKIVTLDDAQWYDAAAAGPDGSGLYTIDQVTAIPGSALPAGSGPEGIVYVGAGSPQFSQPSVLVSEYDANAVGAYPVGLDGDPIVAQRRPFITGLDGAQGAYVDPATGDFLFSTFGDGDQSRVTVVQGFSKPPSTAVVTLTAPANGSVSADPTPRYQGTASDAAGAARVTVRVYEGSSVGTSNVVQTLRAPRTGTSWGIDGSTPLADGTYTARAEQADLTGATALSAPVTFTIRAPIAPPPPPPNDSFIEPSSVVDRDADTIADIEDNCADTPNPEQEDKDADGIGDICDTSDASGGPVLAKSVVGTVVRGDVFVRYPAGFKPRATSAQAAQAPAPAGFVPLKGAVLLPVGSVVDTSRGRVTIDAVGGTNATSRAPRKVQSSDFYDGVFQIKQARAKKPITDILLRSPTFAKTCASSSGKSARAAAARGNSKKVVTRLYGNGKGNFRTRGRNSTATVRGTIWLTQERCDGTVTKVTRGLVAVRDLRAGRTVNVRAGRSYLARAKRAAVRRPRRP